MKEQIKQELYRRAASYVPEWTQNTQDIGGALLDIYADMHVDSLLRLESLRQKRSAQFFNRLGADQKPAVPAQGYVTFGLSSDEVAGTVVYQHAALNTSRTRADGTMVPAETVDDVFVTPSRLEVIVQSRDDYISKTYENFDNVLSLEGENVQAHALTLSIAHCIDLKHHGEIRLRFYRNKDEIMPHEALMSLVSFAQFFYSTADGYRPFALPCTDGDAILLRKDNDDEIAPCGEEAHSSIQITTTQAALLEDFTLRDLRISTKAGSIAPDSIYAVGVQFDGSQAFYPFGERASIYNEVYFACTEAFTKKGARVEMDFILDFDTVEGTNLADTERNFKLIMNKRDIKQNPVYDITIEEVIFEYFNGYGFVNLFANKKYSDLFSTVNGTHRQRRSIVFTCPDDMASTIVNGVYGHFIRARVTHINNAFKLRTQFISPALSAVNFGFAYPEVGNQPQTLCITNNLSDTLCTPACFDLVRPLQPFQTVSDARHCVYFGFTQPLTQGPIKILFDVAFGKPRRKLIWQYYGKNGFVNLDLLDQTSALAHTGIITLKDLADHTKAEIFGESCYFLRLIDTDEHAVPQPVRLNGIHINTTYARATQSGLTKLFSVNRYDGVYAFDLEEQHVYQAQVFVDETDDLHATSLHNRQIHTDENDRLWVEWHDIATHKGATDRIYQLDPTNGILRFPAQPKLPAISEEKNIRVNFSVGGGADSNFTTGEIGGLARSQGFISQATNLLPFYGGSDCETETVAKACAASEFRHKMRAVTARDYENLVQYYSCNVCRVQCFSNTNQSGEPSIGSVTLVVLTINYLKNDVFFDRFRAQVLDYLADKTLHGMHEKISIMPPNFVKFNVQAQVKVANFNQISHTREAVQQALDAFLHPITGNFNQKGFAIGEPPKREQLEALILDIKSVETIKNLVVTGEIFDGEQSMVLNPDEIAKIPFVLPQSGTHTIQIDLHER